MATSIKPIKITVELAVRCPFCNRSIYPNNFQVTVPFEGTELTALLQLIWDRFKNHGLVVHQFTAEELWNEFEKFQEQKEAQPLTMDEAVRDFCENVLLLGASLEPKAIPDDWYEVMVKAEKQGYIYTKGGGQMPYLVMLTTEGVKIAKGES